MYYKEWNIEEMTGYKPISTFYMDFSIADHFGAKAVRSTYRQAVKEWKTNCPMVTELVMVLNWKIWEHYQSNKVLARLYNDLWQELQAWCYGHLKGSDLEYFARTID